MAVNTTVEVVMPPMGDSVSEGSILEWHRQEGDEVSEDETLVEISTDKVDAEVPAPGAAPWSRSTPPRATRSGWAACLPKSPRRTDPVPRSARTNPRPTPRTTRPARRP